MNIDNLYYDNIVRDMVHSVISRGRTEVHICIFRPQRAKQPCLH